MFKCAAGKIGGLGCGILMAFSASAVVEPEHYGTEYCVVPVMDQPGDADLYYNYFFKTYPFAPHVLLDGQYGSLWTIKDFNRASVYQPKVHLSYLDSSVYFRDPDVIYTFSDSPHGYKIQGDQAPIRVSEDELMARSDWRDRLSSQRNHSYHRLGLEDGLQLAVSDKGLQLTYPSGLSLPIQGNHLVRPDGVDLYPLAGRGDILVKTYNGLFIVAKNQGDAAQYCERVKPDYPSHYRLVPLMEGVRNDVISSAKKIDAGRYLIFLRSGALMLKTAESLTPVDDLSKHIKVVTLEEADAQGLRQHFPHKAGEYALLQKAGSYGYGIKLPRDDQGWRAHGRLEDGHSFLVSRGAISMAILDPDFTVRPFHSPNNKAGIGTLFNLGQSLFSYHPMVHSSTDLYFSQITLNGITRVGIPGKVKHIHPLVEKPGNGAHALVFEAVAGGVYLLSAVGTVNPYPHFPLKDTSRLSHMLSDAERLFYIDSNRIFVWSPGAAPVELARFDPRQHGHPLQLIKMGKDLVLVTYRGLYRVLSDGQLQTLLADPYQVGAIEKVSPLENHNAWLVESLYGPFIVDHMGVTSRLSLEGRESSYFYGRLDSDNTESYLGTDSEIYRLDVKGDRPTPP
ncbi:MAG: hypothetical protein ABWY06_02055 [Pseudomonas sp.]|uniref:hypothetical protein n=1 Tax=Pseudomonas sp. TaxID=306 RepID=UPI00339A99B7